jgi:hypothetical protein
MTLYDKIVEKYPDIVANALLDFPSIIENTYSDKNDFLYQADGTLKINLISDYNSYIGYVRGHRVFFAQKYPVVHFNLIKDHFKCNKIMWVKFKPRLNEMFELYGYRYLTATYVTHESGRYIELQYYEHSFNGNYLRFMINVFEILTVLYSEKI